tara:strand:+ start:460 stop:735 length:276 start_codon:yes stop_codon:yes gene_type:complete
MATGARFRRAPAPGAVEKVRAVEPEALGLGWASAELWATEAALAWPSGAFGLVCALDAYTEIVAVSATDARLCHWGEGGVERVWRRRGGEL